MEHAQQAPKTDPVVQLVNACDKFTAAKSTVDGVDALLTALGIRFTSSVIEYKK